VFYGLVMLFGSRTRKRIVSSGLCSSTVALWLSCVPVGLDVANAVRVTLPVERLVERLGRTGELSPRGDASEVCGRPGGDNQRVPAVVPTGGRFGRAGGRRLGGEQRAAAAACSAANVGLRRR
jgi:hypothetical protein